MFSDTISITYSAVQSSPPNTKMTLFIKAGLRNPSWIVGEDNIPSIEMTTYTADKQYMID